MAQLNAIVTDHHNRSPQHGTTTAHLLNIYHDIFTVDAFRSMSNLQYPNSGTAKRSQPPPSGLCIVLYNETWHFSWPWNESVIRFGYNVDYVRYVKVFIINYYICCPCICCHKSTRGTQHYTSAMFKRGGTSTCNNES